MSVILNGDSNEISSNGRIIFGSETITIPSGNTLQRPGVAREGMIRFNTQIGSLEGYNGNTWSNLKVELV